MKKFLVLALLFAAGFVASAQNLYYRYEKISYNDATEKYHTDYFIRICRVHDDVSISYKDYLLNELFGKEYDYYRTRIVVNINGDIISFYEEYSDEYLPVAQFKIESDAALTSFKDFDESKSSLAEVTETFNQLCKTENKDNKPYNGWSYGGKLFKLNNNGEYFWIGYDDYWLVKKNGNSFMGYRVDYKNRYSLFSLEERNPSVVCYAPGKAACMNSLGNVMRTDISDLSNPKQDMTLWNKFINAVKKCDSSELGKMLDHQLSPSDFNEELQKDVITIIAETKNPDFILNAFKAIDAAYGIFYPSYGGSDNPLQYLIEQKDSKSVRKVLEWKNELADFASFNGQFSHASPVRKAVDLDDVEMVKTVLPYVKDVNKIICMGSKESDGGGSYNHTCNLLSFAKSEEMKKVLISAGVKTLIPYNGYEKETCLIDSNVNIRDSAGLSGKKIDRLNNGEKVKVIAIDPYFYDIDNYKGHWIQIEYSDGKKKGYIFEKYLNQYWQ
ncbi:hypothetical protein HNP77_002261 [Treponema rectale]|uniref:SH3b domain-containing protein n=1 Tax=Treponema rectale TaxID=744512 RepID=A0A840SKJ8_9SPIR|nr:SH3 domain-containing protein [Treponema rectale]MBB5219872.1 hypothetical protein [Treponema rectale]